VSEEAKTASPDTCGVMLDDKRIVTAIVGSSERLMSILEMFQAENESGVMNMFAYPLNPDDFGVPDRTYKIFVWYSDRAADFQYSLTVRDVTGMIFDYCAGRQPAPPPPEVALYSVTRLRVFEFLQANGV
jgi:hypothetical protein